MTTANESDGHGDNFLDEEDIFRPITSADEIADNFNLFQREARRHPRRTRLILAQTKYWIHEENSEAFGPCKFLGHMKMDFIKYEHRLKQRGLGSNRSKSKNRAKDAIENTTGQKFEPNELLGRRCLDWGINLFGKGVWGNTDIKKWTFVRLTIPERESVSDFPDEITQPEKFLEGTLRTTMVVAFERNRKAVQQCKAHHGVRCTVCNMDFVERYGEIGQGFIHVHHLKMLSEIRETYELNPVKDLRPVCPNCHAMIHRQTPPMSLDELRKRLRG